MSTTSTTELCPVDGATPLQVGTHLGHPSSLTLYSLTDELAQLVAVRAEMLESGEDTAAVDGEIAAYIDAVPAKVDATTHVMHTLESQIALAKVEADRLAARRRNLQTNLDWLKDYLVSVLEKLPAPKRGMRKLEGSTSTVALKKNGGVQPLEIQDEALVPDEYCTATVTMPWSLWLSTFAPYDFPNVKAYRSVTHAAVRKAINEPCWACEGKGIIVEDDVPCYACCGDGKAGVPGAHLADRGFHVEIR